MTTLDRVLPTPRLLEPDGIDLAVPPQAAWEIVRHLDLGKFPIVHALFAIRTLPNRLAGRASEPLRLRIDDLVSSPGDPGFQILADDPPHEVVVGAIGKVWQPDIPFLQVDDANAYARFVDPGWVKVAWALRVTPLGERDSRVECEVRVDATDDASWRKFVSYFRVIGAGSRFIRRSVLNRLAHDYGTPESKLGERPLDGDELLPDAIAEATQSVTIAAKPEAVWPWLVQMGCRRGGFYAFDVLDNGGRSSAREVHPELTHLEVGDLIPATPEGNDGFEVLRVVEPRTLVLGGLYDPREQRQLPFGSPRTRTFWQTTWAFVLEPLGGDTTRLCVRARAAFSNDERLRAAWIRPVHHFMQGAQLRHLRARAEGRLPADDWRDVAEGIGGAAIMAATLLTPFLRGARNHWGVDESTAARVYSGDELISEPRWGWTHGIEIDAPASEVWPWVAQIGADRAGFYSYQWLENAVGCGVRNAEVVHPEWEVREGGTLSLHPKAPPLCIVSVAPGRSFVAYAPADVHARASGGRWTEASWAFVVEPLAERRCRLLSRYRCACSDDVATRVQFGPALLEPIGFAMDRRMLMGIKQRAEAPPS
jgi:hypothetical protein